MSDQFRKRGIPQIPKIEPKKSDAVPNVQVPRKNVEAQKPSPQAPKQSVTVAVSPGINKPPLAAERGLTAPNPDTRSEKQKKAVDRREYFLSEARKIADMAASIERLEESRSTYTNIIKEAGIQIDAPLWGAVKEKISPFGVARSIREGKKIKNNLGHVSVGAREAAQLEKYRNWLIGRVGEKIGGNEPNARPAGIEKRLADALRNEFGIGVPALRQIAAPTDHEKQQSENVRRALKILKGLKMQEPHIVDRFKRNILHAQQAKAWIYKPPFSLAGGFFFIRPDASEKDVLRAIKDAIRKPEQKRKPKKKQAKRKKKKPKQTTTQSPKASNSEVAKRSTNVSTEKQRSATIPPLRSLDPKRK